MVRAVSVFLLASCLAATAFSQRPSGNRLSTQKSTLSPLKRSVQFKTASALKAASDVGGTVAAAPTPAPAPTKSFIDLIWNDNTKLSVYLAVWYLGNIYCKLDYRLYYL
jgi:hypothetical protein